MTKMIVMRFLNGSCLVCCVQKTGGDTRVKSGCYGFAWGAIWTCGRFFSQPLRFKQVQYPEFAGKKQHETELARRFSGLPFTFF